MATTMIALTLAVNLEQTLRNLQTTLFRENEDASSRLFPPLIPITTTVVSPSDPTLDAIRKRNTLSLVEDDTGGEPFTRVTSGIAHLPVRLDGWDSLQNECRSLSTPASTPPLLTETPAIHLAWNSPVGWSTTVPDLRPTEAFWLTVYEIDAGNPVWWDGCRYRVLFRRRLSVSRA